MGNVALWILGIRIVISILGIIGNTALILFLVQKQIVKLKTFEVLLLGLSVSNLEEIFIVDIYDILVVRVSISLDVWACRSLKFLTVVGQVASILFTVLISIFRYQKLRDAEKVNLPIFLDNIRYAWAMSGLCVMSALLLAAPTYVMNMDGHMKNITGNQKCPPHFFLCYRDNCPTINKLYKYLFVVLSNLLPLLVVTVSSCLIIKVLLGQKRMVKPGLGAPGSEQEPKRKNRSPRFHRSTVAILAAMALFQIDWTLYLVLHLGYSPYDFPAWSELEFLISTAYTTISPYVYGIGNNILTWKNIRR